MVRVCLDIENITVSIIKIWRCSSILGPGHFMCWTLFGPFGDFQHIPLTPISIYPSFLSTYTLTPISIYPSRPSAYTLHSYQHIPLTPISIYPSLLSAYAPHSYHQAASNASAPICLPPCQFVRPNLSAPSNSSAPTGPSNSYSAPSAGTVIYRCGPCPDGITPVRIPLLGAAHVLASGVYLADYADAAVIAFHRAGGTQDCAAPWAPIH